MAGKLIKAGLAYTICNVILRGISFFTVPLFIRLLTPLEFGKYNVFISIEGILFVISGLAIHCSIKNALYDKKETYDDYVKNCVYIDIVASIIIGVLGNFACLFFSEAIDLTFTEVNLLTISGFCQSLISIYTAKLIMNYQSGDFVIVSFITVIFGIALSLLFIFTIFDSNRYFGRIWGAVGGQIIAAVYILWRLFKNGIAHININDWKYGLKISLPIVPHGISQVILSSSDRIMIKYIHNAILAGIYSFTYTISLVPQILFASLSKVWEPWFFEQMDKEDKHAIQKGSHHFFILITSAYILMACIVPEIVMIMATPDYYDCMDISIIILIGYYFATLYYIPCEVEYFHKKTKYIAFSTVSCAILNIILNYYLLTHFSYKSAAVSTVVSYFLYFLFHMYMAYKISGYWPFDIKRMGIGILIFFTLISITLLSISSIYTRIIIFICVSAYTLLHFKEFLNKRVKTFISTYIWKQHTDN